MQAFKLDEMQAFAIRMDQGWMKRVQCGHNIAVRVVENWVNTKEMDVQDQLAS